MRRRLVTAFILALAWGAALGPVSAGRAQSRSSDPEADLHKHRAAAQQQIAKQQWDQALASLARAEAAAQRAIIKLVKDSSGASNPARQYSRAKLELSAWYEQALEKAGDDPKKRQVSQVELVRRKKAIDRRYKSRAAASTSARKKKAARLNLTRATMMVQRTGIYRRQGKNNLATELRADAAGLRLQAYQALGDRANALASAKGLVTLQGVDVENLLAAAETLEQAKQYPLAIKALRRALVLVDRGTKGPVKDPAAADPRAARRRIYTQLASVYQASGAAKLAAEARRKSR